MKNGGGGAGRNRPAQSNYDDHSYSQNSYGSHQGQAQQSQPQASAAPSGDDPYAPCKFKAFVVVAAIN